MKFIYFILGALVFNNVALSYAADAYQGKHYYIGENRIILVKVNRPFTLQKQQEIAQNNLEGFSERKLLILTIQPDDYKLTNFSDEDNVFLVGLDGEIKAASKDVFTTDILFKKIDAMPMRQIEMQQSN